MQKTGSFQPRLRLFANNANSNRRFMVFGQPILKLPKKYEWLNEDSFAID